MRVDVEGVASNGRSMVLTFEQKTCNPAFYVKPDVVNFLRCPESLAIVQYYQDKPPETFTLKIPFARKMEPKIEIKSCKTQTVSVMALTVSAVQERAYGEAILNH